jgi:hypothetical protein
MSSGTTELAWFKSSYSGSQGDSCVEIAGELGTVREVLVGTLSRVFVTMSASAAAILELGDDGLLACGDGPVHGGHPVGYVEEVAQIT